jgi:Spy/CpxP family protein refolding chaperone
MSMSADRGTAGTGAGGRGGAGAKARAVLGALSLMVLGAVIGVAIDRHLGAGAPPTGTAAAFHEMTMGSLEDRLDLTAEQRRRIDAIVAARHESLRYAWQAVHAHLGAAVDTVHQEIEAVLTPEQRTAFRAWLRESPPGPAH